MPDITYEYAPFGPTVLRRKAGSTDDWKPVPANELEDARVEVKLAERLREESIKRGGQFSIQRLN